MFQIEVPRRLHVELQGVIILGVLKFIVVPELTGIADCHPCMMDVVRVKDEVNAVIDGPAVIGSRCTGLTLKAEKGRCSRASRGFLVTWRPRKLNGFTLTGEIKKNESANPAVIHLSLASAAHNALVNGMVANTYIFKFVSADLPALLCNVPYLDRWMNLEVKYHQMLYGLLCKMVGLLRRHWQGGGVGTGVLC